MIVEAQVTINATRAAVWRAITDIERGPQIVSGIKGIEIVGKPASGLVGLVWKETRILFDKPATVEKRISEAVDGERYTTTAESDGFVFLTTYRISGSDGGVTLTSIHDSRPQGLGPKLMSIPMTLFFKGVVKKAVLQDLNDIKRVVEEGK
jgi:uncharacterized protein YndB with AHSA1/START domain